MLYKYYTDKESELDLDLPELSQTPVTTKSKPSAKQANISSYSTSNSVLSSSSSLLMYQEDGFNPFGAVLGDCARAAIKNTYDPDWAARLMDTYTPNLLENGAKFYLTFSIIEGIYESPTKNKNLNDKNIRPIYQLM